MAPLPPPPSAAAAAAEEEEEEEEKEEEERRKNVKGRLGRAEPRVESRESLTVYYGCRFIMMRGRRGSLR